MDIRVSGPIFDGRAEQELRDVIEESQREVAAQGYADVMTILNRDIRHPTPYYETQITTRQDGPDRVVTDRGVIYGPWLEGTGSRNAPVTPFKGYAAFHRATEQLRQQTPQLVQVVLRRHIGRMQ
jgi:hypothetical protein